MKSVNKIELFRTEHNGNVSFAEEGQGEPLILLHGLFGNLSNWSETIKFFSSKYRVITPLLPIYQASWKSDVLTELVDYVHIIVQKLRLNKITLIGNSLGGHVALLYTLKYPEQVKNLVLTGSSGLFENNLGVSYPKKGDFKYISEKVKLAFFNEEVATHALVREVYETVNDIRKSIGVLKAAKAASRNNLKEYLEKISTPVLLIWGKEDRVTPLDVAFQFLELLSGRTELHIIEECGHAPMMEQPEQFNSILADYLKRKEEELTIKKGPNYKLFY